jgi:hypothetical protein
MKIICIHHVVALWQKGESWGAIEARSDRWRRKLPRQDYVLRSVFLLSRGRLQCDLDDAQPLAMVDIRERYAGLWRGIQDGVIERRSRARPLRQHKSERAISLARPRPLYSDFQRSGSGSRSQPLFPGIIRHPRAETRVFLTLLRSHSLQELSHRRPFPVAWTEFRCRFSKTTAGLLSPLEDRSSAESNITLGERRCQWPCNFLLWK